jgi:hypothetical protein
MGLDVRLLAQQAAREIAAAETCQHADSSQEPCEDQSCTRCNGTTTVRVRVDGLATAPA